MEKKALLITNVPTPYRIPLFDELHNQLVLRNVRLKIVFGARGYARRKWKIDLGKCKFSYTILSSPVISIFGREKAIFTYRRLLSVIREEKPEIIIASGFSFATMKVWLQSIIRKTPYIIWSGATVRHDIHDSWIRTFQRKILVKRGVGFIAYGSQAREYLLKLGAPPKKVSIATNTVDTRLFLEQTRENNPRIDDSRRKKILLYVGYFEKRKRVDLLLYVVSSLAKKRSDFVLELVGDGPTRDKLTRLSNDLGIADYVRFEGYKQINDMIPYLKRADCFLFPTDYDIWGLTLVEAMAIGIPCISSLRAGAAHDLIIDGVNGFAVDDFSRVSDVAEKTDWILSNPEEAKILGDNAKEYIKRNVKLEDCAFAFAEAVSESL